MGCISMIVDVFRSLRQSLQYVWHLLLLIHIQICQKTHKLHAVLLGHVGSELKLMHPTDWGGWGGGSSCDLLGIPEGHMCQKGALQCQTANSWKFNCVPVHKCNLRLHVHEYIGLKCIIQISLLVPGMENSNSCSPIGASYSISQALHCNTCIFSALIMLILPVNIFRKCSLILLG